MYYTTVQELGRHDARGPSNVDVLGVDSACLGGVVSLEDAHQSVSLLKHVVTQTDDNELGILSALLSMWEGIDCVKTAKLIRTTCRYRLQLLYQCSFLTMY